MQDLSLDGQPVRFSRLSHRAFKASPCQVLLPVTRENREAAIAEFRQAGAFGKYSGLWVSGIADLSFLQEFDGLRYLEVVEQDRVNVRQLDGLCNLRGLRVDSPGGGIDFSRFPELEVFVGGWHAGHAGLDACQELRTLRIQQFKPRSSDLSELTGPTRLETLELTKTDITSFRGLERAEDLRYVDIAYAPKLTSLDALADGTSEIRELSLSHARKIESYAPLAALRHLRRLRLSSCAPMPDLDWTRGMMRLDFFSFVETNVEDGNLSPLLELPSLRYVGTMDKKHFNMKFEQLNQQLRQRFPVDAGRGGSDQ